MHRMPWVLKEGSHLKTESGEEYIVTEVRRQVRGGYPVIELEKADKNVSENMGSIQD